VLKLLLTTLQAQLLFLHSIQFAAKIARMALEFLIADGRIQPAKIEEMVEKAKNEINKIIKEKGEQAVYECGVFNLDPRIVHILGRLISEQVMAKMFCSTQ
jgi:hypothetical protein